MRPADDIKPAFFVAPRPTLKIGFPCAHKPQSRRTAARGRGPGERGTKRWKMPRRKCIKARGCFFFSGAGLSAECPAEWMKNYSLNCCERNSNCNLDSVPAEFLLLSARATYQQKRILRGQGFAIVRRRSACFECDFNWDELLSGARCVGFSGIAGFVVKADLFASLYTVAFDVIFRLLFSKARLFLKNSGKLEFKSGVICTWICIEFSVP